ncbi:nitroreductase [Methanoculleus taiwanensis]|uniref:Nitroreductase n=1 Tax=Methanoculleus taiwanensis TaxID=1550565 RepID=A0A498H0D9_9EURY|nr:nitroreductase family protein [Methanoculleus taiwanensis]RXE56389.1 nitroreductase [Methanoculleus taiwanensis]
METIFVDQDLCTRCGICSVVCPISIVDAADDHTLPEVREEKAGMCIVCGHCEVSCPSQALLLNVRPDEKVGIPAGAGALSAEGLGVYLQKRRSVRHYTDDPVSRETILQILDIARYAPSGGNGQPVQWLVVHDPENVQKIAGLTVDWMKTLLQSSHPMSGYVPGLIGAWEAGNDVICRGAPHLLFAHVPEGNPVASVDAIIALTHVDIAAPAFGIGTCWAGFVAMAAASHEPLQRELGLPAGRKSAYAMMFGHPQYRVCGIPRRSPAQVTWR